MGEINGNRSWNPKSVQIGKFSVAPSVPTLAVSYLQDWKNHCKECHPALAYCLNMIVMPPPAEPQYLSVEAICFLADEERPKISCRQDQIAYEQRINSVCSGHFCSLEHIPPTSNKALPVTLTKSGSFEILMGSIEGVVYGTEFLNARVWPWKSCPIAVFGFPILHLSYSLAMLTKLLEANDGEHEDEW
ncbi:hypothetical protein B0H14DRAFT_2594904 [Mycena olivaceomarginata]|nr:hypothetical protein B0H14DRAFT_2594904 [Mycena olivaceomarginata]